eukprot:5619932-Amphidinium_carterae.1
MPAASKAIGVELSKTRHSCWVESIAQINSIGCNAGQTALAIRSQEAGSDIAASCHQTEILHL